MRCACALIAGFENACRRRNWEREKGGKLTRYFLPWRHFDTSSDRLLIALSLYLMMANFSSMQRLHWPDLRLLVFDFFTMS